MLVLTILFAFLIFTGNAQKQDLEKVQLYKFDRLATNCRHQQPDSAIYYVHVMRQIAVSIKDTNEIAYSYTFLGSLKKDIGQTDSALYYYNKAKDYQQRIGFIRGVAGNYNNLGNLYRMQGDYAEAIRYYRMGKELFQEMNDELNTNNLVQNIAELYIQTNRLSDAEEELNATQDFFFNTNNLSGQGFLLRARSSISLQRGDTSLATQYLSAAISLFIQVDRDAEVCRTKAELASLYLVSGNSKLAQKVAKEGLNMADRLGFKKEKAEFLLVLAKSCPGECTDKLNQLEEAAQLAEESGASDLLMKIYPLLAHELSLNGAFKESAIYLQKALRMKDSVFNVESQKAYLEMQVRFRVSEKEKQILLNEREKERAESEAERARSRSFLLVAVAMFSIVLLIMFVWRYRQKKRLSARLSMALNERELLLKEIHHRVKNNLQIISSLLNIQKNAKHSDVNEIITQTQDRIQTMALVHENLYQTDNFKDISAKEYLIGLSEHFNSSYSLPNKQITLTLECEPILLTIDKLIPLGLIFNEAFTNSVKYAFEENGGMINVVLQKLADGKINFEYHDNGKGLPSDFNPKQSRSLGMQLIQGVSKQLNAEFQISGNDGVRISVTFNP